MKLLQLIHRTFFSIISLICISCSVIAAPRAIWIWEKGAFSMLDNPQIQKKTERFLMRQYISTMYLYADEFEGRNILKSEPEKYRKLIADAHARGLKVFALLGSEHLKTQTYILPEKRKTALQMFERVLDFNVNTADTSSRFDGVNIDIEPYLLDDWSKNRALRAKQYLELSTEFMKLKNDSGLNLPVGPAMPFWYDGIEEVTWNGKRRKFNEPVQDIYDYVAIMDYRNVARGSDSMVSLAAEELSYGDKIGKKVLIGVETHKTTPGKITFYGLGVTYFEKQLALAQSTMSHFSSFGGFIIDHLEPYQVMVEEKFRSQK